MGPKKRNLSQPLNTSETKSSRSQTTSSQPNINVQEELSQDIDESVNDCVRFFVYKAGQQLPFRKNEIQKHIKGSVGKGFDRVLERASVILQNVYGFKLILCDGNTKFYIVSNNLPYIEEDNENQDPSKLPEDRQKILLMLVLVHIYMSRTTVTQASLFEFLRSLHIDPERKHELFGDVKKYLTTNLVRQHYVNIEKNTITGNLTFSWGARAEAEISKHELLKFVSKVYKNNPKSWISQYKEAEDQPLENHRNIEVNNEEMNVVTEE